MIVFDEALSFSDGRSFERLEVVANPRSRRTVLFRAPGSGSLYQIPNIKSRSYPTRPAAADMSVRFSLATSKGSAPSAGPFSSWTA